MINLEWGYMWCAKHLRAFRRTWPKHAAFAMTNLFAASAADERILAAAQGDTDRLEPVLREFGPMCCFLPPEVTTAVVEASLADRKWEPTTQDPEVSGWQP